MDMHIHADGRFFESESNHEVGSLASHARQFAELLDCVRYDSVELLFENLGQLFEMPGFVAVEADGIDGFFELRPGDFFEAFAGGEFFEKPSAGGGGAGIFCAGAEDGADKDHEGVFGLDGDEVDDGRLDVAFELLLQSPVDRWYVLSRHGLASL